MPRRACCLALLRPARPRVHLQSGHSAEGEARPMDLNYSPEDVAFRDTTRRWLEANVPREDLTTLGRAQGWHRKLYEAGYLGHGLAQGVRRARARARWSRRSWRTRWRASGAPAPINGLGLGIVGPDHHRARHRGAEAALPPEDPDGRGDLVPALLGAQRRLRPGRASRRAPRTRATTSSSTGRRSGRAAARSPTGASCSRAPTPRWPSTRASPASCMNMRQPGVEVRPLKQITGAPSSARSS